MVEPHYPLFRGAEGNFFRLCQGQNFLERILHKYRKNGFSHIVDNTACKGYIGNVLSVFHGRYFLRKNGNSNAMPPQLAAGEVVAYDDLVKHLTRGRNDNDILHLFDAERNDGPVNRRYFLTLAEIRGIA